MAISHDAYYLDAGDLAIKLRAYISHVARDPWSGYSTLRSDAISVANQNPMAKMLLDLYGGWNGKAIADDLPTVWDQRVDTIGFCFLPILYSQLKKTDLSLGLQGTWQSLNDVLKRCQWTDTDVARLVKGRGFELFFDKYLGHQIPPCSGTQLARDALAAIRPITVGGSVGWLEVNEVADLLNRLDSQKSSKLRQATDINEREGLRLAQMMLASACKHNTGLCLIISG